MTGFFLQVLKNRNPYSMLSDMALALSESRVTLRPQVFFKIPVRAKQSTALS